VVCWIVASFRHGRKAYKGRQISTTGRSTRKKAPATAGRTGEAPLSFPARRVIFGTEKSQVATISGSKNLAFPVCSPDGQFIAATDRAGKKLMLFDLTAQKWSELVNMNVGISDWSADGKYLYFDTGLGNNPALYRLHMSDRKLERLGTLKGFRRQIFSGFPWIGVAPDSSPILLRDTSSQEVYALDFEEP
jgi:hypothetical protein